MPIRVMVVPRMVELQKLLIIRAKVLKHVNGWLMLTVNMRQLEVTPVMVQALVKLLVEVALISKSSVMEVVSAIMRA